MNNQFIVTEDLYADQGKRFVNYIIDRIVFYGLFYVLMILLGIILGFIGGDVDAFFYEIENINRFVDLLITSLLFAIFYFTSEVLMKGRTVGKYITKTIVVDQNGNIPETMTILKRSLCRFIPFNAFSFLSKPCRGWHDSLSDTYVVDKERLDNKKGIHEGLNQLGKNGEDL